MADSIDSDKNSLLEFEVGGIPTQRDLQISTAAVLVKISHSDDFASWNETNEIINLLVKNFDIKSEDAANILDVAQILVKDSKRLTSLIETLKDRFTPAQLTTVATMIWKVMLADGIIYDTETQAAKQIGEILGLTPEQINEAKNQAL